MSDIVPVAVLVAVGSTEAVEIIHNGRPTMKPVIAGFILGVGLYALDGLDDYLGRMFGILIIVAALLRNGQTIFNKLNLSNKTPSKV